MSKLFAIVRREFIEKVRTKAFLIGTLMGPVLFVGIGYVTKAMFGGQSAGQGIAVLDATAGGRAMTLLDSLAAEKVKENDQESPRYRFIPVRTSASEVVATRDTLLPWVDRRDEAGKTVEEALTGILVVTDTGLRAGQITYLGSNVSNLGEVGHLERALRVAMVRERVHALGLPDSVATIVTAKVDLNTGKVSKGVLTGQGSEAAFMFSYILVVLLFVAMMPTGIQVMAAVVEEKGNKILEVLVSSVKPFHLMFGKVLGVGGATMLQIAIWGASAMFFGGLSARGGAAAAAAGASDGAQAAATAMPHISTDLIIIVLVYFFLGFVFFSTAYAAVGAMCNTIQETQQVAFPVTIMVFAGYLGAFLAVSRPESMMAKVMTYIPFTAPFIVPTRWSNSPLPLPELLASIAACALGAIAMVWLAARIYRVGILSYGKKPSFKDLWTWVRHA